MYDVVRKGGLSQRVFTLAQIPQNVDSALDSDLAIIFGDEAKVKNILRLSHL